jgi:hypothetical protein
LGVAAAPGRTFAAPLPHLSRAKRLAYGPAISIRYRHSVLRQAAEGSSRRGARESRARGSGETMDLYATLAPPITAVFEHVAAPSRLGDWLGEVAGVEATTGLPGVGVVFGLTLRRGERLVAATGELVAYEPPWLVAYRLRVGAHTHVLRLECTAGEDATRLHVHQADGDGALSVDLARLAVAVAAAGTSGATGAADWPLSSRSPPRARRCRSRSRGRTA